jgi:hypothetical protein
MDPSRGPGLGIDFPTHLPHDGRARRAVVEPVLGAYAAHHDLGLPPSSVAAGATTLARRLSGGPMQPEKLERGLRYVGCARFVRDSDHVLASATRDREALTHDLLVVLRGIDLDHEMAAETAGESPQALLHILVRRFSDFLTASPDDNEHRRRLADAQRVIEDRRRELVKIARELAGPDAEDVVHDVYARITPAMRRRHMAGAPAVASGPDGMVPYVVRSVQNAAHDVLRARKKAKDPPSPPRPSARARWTMSRDEADVLADHIDWFRTELGTVEYRRRSDQRDMALDGLEALAFEYDEVVRTNPDHTPEVAAVWYAAFRRGRVDHPRITQDDAKRSGMPWRAARRLRRFLARVFDPTEDR